MRLITWNCNKGIYSKKVPLLNPMAADIAVIQECPKPVVESENCLWFGDNPKQGITVLTSPSYKLTRLPTLDDVPKFVVPIEVIGPANFTLFAVWTKTDPQYRYVRGAVKAVEMYREVFAGSPCVLMGDFNSNSIWDNLHPAELNHSALVKVMHSLGLASAYHSFFEEAQGEETRPTYYHRWNRKEPFHIDYCFMPAAWMQQVRNVEVGGYEDWKAASDHRPLVIDIDFNSETAADLEAGGVRIAR
jgi:hypothetical protein